MLQSTGLRTVRRTCADVVKEATPQKHTYVCSEERTVVCRPVLLNTNRGESSSDLCTVKRAAGAGLFLLANEGGAAQENT